MDHDPLCEHFFCHPAECIPMPDGCADCNHIAVIRADERRREEERRVNKFGVWHDFERDLP